MAKFSERGFWRKLRKYAKKIGREGVEQALKMYYAAQSPNTPIKAKFVIYGALAYLIMPIDAIPDFIPITGFTDDLGALAAAFLTVSAYITPEIEEKAKKKADEWFGDENEK